MLFAEVQPFVRFWRSFALSEALLNRISSARDCRLFVLTGGKAAIFLQSGASYPLEYSACLYLPSGIPYEIVSSSAEQPRFCIVNFDFTRQFAALSQPLPLMDERASAPIPVPSLSDAETLTRPLFLPSCPEILPLVKVGEQEFLHSRPHSQACLSALLLHILVLLLRANPQGSAKEAAAERMVQYLTAHYRERLSNADIAAVVGYHPNYANALFLQHTGTTLRQYLLHLRLQSALSLLLSTELPIGEIAARTGFSSPSRFAKDFQMRMGYPPSSFRAKQKEKP